MAGGAGLIAAAVGLMALTWLLLDIFGRGLVHYARLHFRLLDSTKNEPAPTTGRD